MTEEISHEQKPSKKSQARHGATHQHFTILLAISLICVAASAAFYITSSDQLVSTRAGHVHAEAAAADRKKAQEAKDKAAALQAAADALATAKAVVDKAYADAGFSPGSEGVYFKFADANSYTCGYFDCAYVLVTVSQPCNAGVYVAASILRQTTSIGLTNGITAGLPAGGTATVLLQDDTGGGDSFSITDIHCMG